MLRGLRRLDVNPEKKFCTNCHADIEVSKFMPHERFCILNNKFCEECNDVYTIDDFEEHLKSHTEKEKERPKERTPTLFQSKGLESNKITCHYCFSAVSPQDAAEHDAMCSVGFAKCTNCGLKTLRQSLPVHLVECEHQQYANNTRSLQIRKNQILAKLGSRQELTTEEAAFVTSDMIFKTKPFLMSLIFAQVEKDPSLVQQQAKTEQSGQSYQQKPTYNVNEVNKESQEKLNVK